MATALTTLLLAFASSAAALTDMEDLGGKIFKDLNLSINQNQSCKTCHHPSAGFADPENRLDPINFPVSTGSVTTSFGGRNAPSAAYAGFSPPLTKAPDGVWIGGMFWDGRATGKILKDPDSGENLNDPLAEQAQGPFFNPVEMALELMIEGTPDVKKLVDRVLSSNYKKLFLKVFPNTLYWYNTEKNYDAIFVYIAQAIAAYERSVDVTRFTSTFDDFWRACQADGINVADIGINTDIAMVPQGILSQGQLNGLALFNGKAGCANCHVTFSEYADASGNPLPPLFTDHSYDNLGIPVNPRVEELSGVAPQDYGLYNTVLEEEQKGKFKVPTLRNVAKSAPYGHNGFFATLDLITNFYNERDVTDGPWSSFYPEVPENVSSELGSLGLTPQEEMQIVAFMHSLNDR